LDFPPPKQLEIVVATPLGESPLDHQQSAAKTWEIGDGKVLSPHRQAVANPPRREKGEKQAKFDDPGPKQKMK